MVCGHSRRGLAFTMLGTLGKLSLFALVFSDFLIEGAHRDLEFIAIGRLSGKKGGAAPGHDWTAFF
jgi:hypothetical protein